MFKSRLRFGLILLAALAGWLPVRADADPVRQRLRFDDYWKFHLGDQPNGQDPALNDGAWRNVTLPHDWSIEGKFDPHATMGASGGFLPSGVGWYRKQFNLPAASSGQRVSLEFDGVYMNSTVWLNGRKLVNQPYGYTTYFADLTPALKAGGPNLLAVKVDNSDQRNSRWYTGSGIYRHVWLITTGPVHVAPWGVYARTEKANAGSADVRIQVQVVNETTTAQAVTVRTTLLSPANMKLGEGSGDLQVPPGSTQQIEQALTVAKPPLWSPGHPQISQVVTQIMQNGAVLDETTTPFGIRVLTWSVAGGFRLNDVPFKINGGCIHDDNGVLGTAAFDRAEQRKADLVKAAGFNEVRTAHNPFAPAFLDECDRIGLLVMEDTFDAWDKPKAPRDYSVYFKDWWQRDLDSLVRRDRNHPSIIMWDIGNEVQQPAQEPSITRTRQLVDFIHHLDHTRPVTEAMFGWVTPEEMAGAQKVWAAQDITGTNYALSNHLAQEGQYPNRMLISTENSDVQEQSGPYDTWQAVMRDTHVVGDNAWTAMDYLGESGLGRWYFEGDPATEPELSLKPQPPPVGQGDDRVYPWHGSPCGYMDILGNLKPMGHWSNIVRGSNGENLYLGVVQPPKNGMKVSVFSSWGWVPTWASWTWPGYENKPLSVEVYCTLPSARLYLNGKLLGEQPTSGGMGYRTTFTVPYQPGTLKVAAVNQGREVSTLSFTSAGDAVALKLTPDRTTLTADGQDISFIKVQVVDKNGLPQPNANPLITFQVQGAGTNAGIGSACLSSTESYQGTQCHAWYGEAQIAIRSTEAAGAITVTAHADHLTDGSAHLQTTPAPTHSL